RVNPRVWPSWDAFERALPELGAPFFFTSRGAGVFQSVRYPRPAVLIFGRESVGLPPDLLARHRDRTVSIPMRDPDLRSLNLSTSVALATYEARRQWG
ncbi:MAG: methyltransferase, partial [Myxococcales bacterium]|nr:methyltransferase [Myxococcales bacterium]